MGCLLSSWARLGEASLCQASPCPKATEKEASRWWGVVAARSPMGPALSLGRGSPISKMGTTGHILLAPARRKARKVKRQLNLWGAPMGRPRFPCSLRAQDPAQGSSSHSQRDFCGLMPQDSDVLPLGLWSHSALERRPLVFRFFCEIGTSHPGPSLAISHSPFIFPL